MSRASGRGPRCVRCRLPVKLCVCDGFRPVPTECRIRVLIHPIEARRPSNTGHLARWLLPSATVELAGEGRRRARPEATGARRLAGLGSGPPVPAGAGDGPVVVLFPRDDAEVLTSALRDPGPVTLVVPDAPWRQARQMARLWPGLRELPAVRLPDGPPGRFRLRKTRLGPGAFGTLEGIARALGILECQWVEDTLLAVHDRLVQRGLYARGRGPADPELARRLQGGSD